MKIIGKPEISDEIRDEAATVLACAASSPGGHPRDAAGDALGATFEACALAWEAWSAVYDALRISGGTSDLRTQYAEAEALLRTGWTP